MDFDKMTFRDVLDRARILAERSKPKHGEVVEAIIIVRAEDGQVGILCFGDGFHNQPINIKRLLDDAEKEI